MNFQSQTRSQKILKFSSSVAGKIHILVTKIDQGHDHQPKTTLGISFSTLQSESTYILHKAKQQPRDS